MARARKSTVAPVGKSAAAIAARMPKSMPPKVRAAFAAQAAKRSAAAAAKRRSG